MLVYARKLVYFVFKTSLILIWKCPELHYTTVYEAIVSIYSAMYTILLQISWRGH